MKDCIRYARVKRVQVCYCIDSNLDQHYFVSFGSLRSYDDWRYHSSNFNKLILSTKICYDYSHIFQEDLPVTTERVDVPTLF